VRVFFLIAPHPSPLAFLARVCTYRVLDPEYKVNIYVKIAQLYLEDDEAVQAETFLNRASILVPDCKEPSLHMRYKVRRPTFDLPLPRCPPVVVSCD
jgi:hypothetical protein